MVSSFQQCDYMAIVSRTGNELAETDYSRPSMEKSEKHYIIRQKKKIKTGNWKVWDSAGKLRSNLNYKNGKLDGTLLTYWENGSIKRKDIFEDDSLVNGACYDREGNKLTHFPYEIQPEFPGGQKAFYKFLERHIYYPQTAGAISWKVMARFLVTKTGEIKDIEILNKSYGPMKDEVIRALKKMPKWHPGRIDGEPEDSYFTFPVNFIAN